MRILDEQASDIVTTVALSVCVQWIYIESLETRRCGESKHGTYFQAHT